MESVVFSPLLPMPLIIGLAVLAAAGVALALWRGLTGWWLRGLAALVLLAALAGPSLLREDRTPVSSIAIVVVDDSASNRIDGRDAQLAGALEGLEDRLERLGRDGKLEVRTVHVADSGEDGTLLLSALAEATAELPADRIAGAVLVTDGVVHDPDALGNLPGAGAGAADRQRRGLGPPGGDRDRAGLRHRRRGGEPGAAGRGHRRRPRGPGSCRCRSRSTATSRCASTCR